MDCHQLVPRSPCGHIPSSLPSAVCPSLGAAECTGIKGREGGEQGVLEQGLGAATLPCLPTFSCPCRCLASLQLWYSLTVPEVAHKLLRFCWSCIKVCSGRGSQDERVAPDSCRGCSEHGTKNHLLFLSGRAKLQKST